jgi:hypothetical protein
MRSRLSTDFPFTCVTCEIEIAGQPTFHVGLPFCCAGCVAGGPCTCSYDASPGDSRVRECLDVEVAVGGAPSRQLVGSVAGPRQ